MTLILIIVIDNEKWGKKMNRYIRNGRARWMAAKYAGSHSAWSWDGILGFVWMGGALVASPWVMMFGLRRQCFHVFRFGFCLIGLRQFGRQQHSGHRQQNRAGHGPGQEPLDVRRPRGGGGVEDPNHRADGTHRLPRVGKLHTQILRIPGHVKSAGPVGGELLVHGGKQQFEHDDWHRVRPERDIGAVDNSIGNKMKQNKKKHTKK